jgi:hypothetical protein
MYRAAIQRDAEATGVVSTGRGPGNAAKNPPIRQNDLIALAFVFIAFEVLEVLVEHA